MDKKRVENYIARPGHSQHQLGSVIDFGSINIRFAKIKASHWLTKNAYKYGFLILSEGILK